MRRAFVKLIMLYQFLLSPWVGNSCRFHPTCSEYAKGVIERYGIARGGWLAAKRLFRCHPWHAGGADPVP